MAERIDRFSKREPEPLANATRAAIALGASLALAAAALAPGQDAPTVRPTSAVSTAPATTAATAATTTTTAATTEDASATQPAIAPPAAPPRSAPRSRPTTADVLEAARSGDVIVQTGEALSQLDLGETLRRTPWYAWTYAALSAFIGVALGRLLNRIIRRFGKRSSDRMQLIRAVAINSFAGPAGLIVAMVGVGYGLWWITLSPPVAILVVRAWQLLTVGVVGWLLFNLTEVVSLVMLRASRGRQGNLSMAIVPVTRRTLRAVLLIGLLLFTANNVLGLSIQTLLAGVGIAGLAVSLAAQDTLKNLFGSVMIFADQPFHLGDTVRIDAFEGTIEDIGFRSTRLRTADGFLVSIPNAKVADAAITNLSRKKSIRRLLELALPYGTTAEQLDDVLRRLRALLDRPEFGERIDHTRETPRVVQDELRPGGLRVRVIYWFAANDGVAFGEHAEAFNRALVETMSEAGVKFGWAG